MAWLKRAWRWCKRNWQIIAGALGIVVAAIAAGMFRKDIQRALINKRKVEVHKNKVKIAKLEGKREIIRRREGEVADEVEAIDKEIKAIDMKIEIDGREIKKMSAKRKLKEFKDLGY